MPSKILRSRIVLPLVAPPIENGAVLIKDDTIIEVAPFSSISRNEDQDLIDLGESILLPGLINCHCHLDYTKMAGMIPPLKHFSDWIKAIIAIKASWSYTEFADSWISGARMLERSGVTSVVDIEAVPELLPEVWPATPLRLWSCLELINVRSKTSPATLVSDALSQVATLESSHPNQCGLSPHALYTTTDELRQEALHRARHDQRVLTTHIAESKEESAMYQSATGPLHDWLAPQGNAAHCGEGSPIAILERTGYLNYPILAAHVNNLDAEDASQLASHHASVAHCPRSHAYFNHPHFDWRSLQKAGVNITLGTDSLASVKTKGNTTPRLDMFAEMTCLATSESAPQPIEILRWATINGAKAIFRSNDLGQLKGGFKADLIAIPFNGPITKASEAVVSFDGEVSFSIINGTMIGSLEQQAHLSSNSP